jgi:hypothetical protein
MSLHLKKAFNIESSGQKAYYKTSSGYEIMVNIDSFPSERGKLVWKSNKGMLLIKNMNTMHIMASVKYIKRKLNEEAPIMKSSTVQYYIKRLFAMLEELDARENSNYLNVMPEVEEKNKDTKQEKTNSDRIDKLLKRIESLEKKLIEKDEKKISIKTYGSEDLKKWKKNANTANQLRKSSQIQQLAQYALIVQKKEKLRCLHT